MSKIEDYTKELEEGAREVRRHRRGRIARKAIKWTVLGILMLVGVLIVYFAVRFYPVYKEYSESAEGILTEMDENTFRRSGNTYIYDDAGDLIGKIGNEKYRYVDLGEVSAYVIDGYVAREDKRFYEHKGVDWRATARAALALVRNRGTITQGGSTITQQVVKNNLLSQEQTYERKFMEIILAMRLETQYSKDEIMEFYVNSCYYGENCYGIEGASEYYFGKSAADLSLAEAAMLVATSNSPSAHNPVADYGYAVNAKDNVLSDMLEEGYITQEQYAQALSEEPDIVQQTEYADSDSYMISYALHCLALELMKDDGFEFQYTFASQAAYDGYVQEYNETYYDTLSSVRSGGYRIYTSFNTDAQALLQQSVDSGLSGFTETGNEGAYKMQGAAVCIDNGSGLVIAMVGGRGTEGSFNRAYQSKRQSGSAIKPLLDYGPALEEGLIYPDTVYTDERIDDNGYSPANAGDTYYGDVTVREAVARSLNSVALQVFLDTGINTALSYLGDMEFSSLTYADSEMDGISLGGFSEGVTACDMARGYYTLENGGECTDASCLRRVVSESGDEVYNVDNDAGTSQVFADDAAFLMTDMMQGVFREEYGTAHDAYDGTQIYAGKTGTANDGKDAWFCGYSRYYTTVVWTGCDDPEPVDGLTGSSYPLSIWSSFMAAMHEGLPKQDFPVPDRMYLVNAAGEAMEVVPSADSYAARPEGYEYRSTRLDPVYVISSGASEDDSALFAAQAALLEFEAFIIQSDEDAVSLDGYYSEVISLINAVPDADIRAEMLARAAAQYAKLSEEADTTWAGAAERLAEAEFARAAEAAQSQAAAEREAEAAAQASQEAALREAEQVSTVRQYIARLNQMSSYTAETDSVISAARSALSKCTSYDGYDALRQELDSAIARIEAVGMTESTETSQEPAVTERGSDDEASDAPAAGTRQPDEGAAEEGSEPAAG